MCLNFIIYFSRNNQLWDEKTKILHKVKTFVIIMTFCHYDLPKRDLLFLEDEKFNKCTNYLL